MGRIGRRRMARVAWLFVGLQLLVGLNGPFGLGLCVAEDGHTSVELPHASSSCARDARRHHADSQAVDAAERDRHPCVDIPLLQSRSCVRGAEIRLLPPAPAAVISLAPALETRATAAAWVGVLASAPASRREALRSTVLLV